MMDMHNLRLAGAMAAVLGLTMPATVLRAQDTATTATADTMQQDSTQWGYDVNADPSVQNPPGYRGLERPAGLPDTTMADTGVADEMDRTGQMQRQEGADTATDQNPPGFRGLERPAELSDTAAVQDTAAAAGDTAAAAGDTAGAMVDTAAMQHEGMEEEGMQHEEMKHEEMKHDEMKHDEMKKKMEEKMHEGEAQDTSAEAAEGAAAAMDTTSADSTDVVHRQRDVPPGVGYAPPPYPADSEQAWVEDMPEGDSVGVELMPADSVE